MVSTVGDFRKNAGPATRRGTLHGVVHPCQAPPCGGTGRFSIRPCRRLVARARPGIMEPVLPVALAAAIKQLHNCTARYVESVVVRDEFRGVHVFEREVAIFDLTGHPTAARAYAW